ncbi:MULTISPECIES: TIGR03619 family F420-dependent LLM class oxidoreductase [unclassified Rhodococcus (in: high G+C Gram-positive bacteria)]|uniref:TIGR03619 family F420-dependent LLM class oxidoreductase n=1 Tax=unclassified Rhodococcus (in: high G+C Gram-positive bacteria) TaxID=192944 RepID=UPI0015E8A9BD|nr:MULTISPECIES: TIGR03619 family F420-dependent LLM class oxidoreductase [unclassified Rhodococcus (in: high G+C Gram-positive bacteria)]
MSLGISLYGSDPRFLVPIARLADDLGFDSIWVGEHIVAPEVMNAEHPYEGGWSKPAVVSADQRMYDLWTMIGAISAATTNARIITGISLLPLRHPIISARACITAQQISNGRFVFGVGAGWLGTEFEALGVSFKDRGRRYDECLDILDKLFRGGPVEHKGDFYSFPLLALINEAIQVPMVMGGTKGPAIRRAARRGDGWYGTTVPLEETVRIRDEIERLRREAGRDYLPFSYYNRITGRPIAESLDRYRAEGFEDLVIPFEAIHPAISADLSLDARLDSLTAVAKEIGLEPKEFGEVHPPSVRRSR